MGLAETTFVSAPRLVVLSVGMFGMSRLRVHHALGAVLMFVAAATACSTSDHQASTSTSPSAETHLVGLGDSVPAAAGCSCTSFVTIFGDDIRRHTGRPGVTENLARNGLDTEGLLRQLDDPAVQRTVAGADLLTVTIGANDFGPARDEFFAGACGGPDGLDCVRTALSRLRENLSAVLTRIRALAAGHPLGVRVTNYWNIFEVSEAANEKYGDAFPSQSDRITREANSVICDVARHAGDVCIDVYTAYREASPTGEPTALLAPDGDHPNQAGHDLIARTIAAAGYAPL